MSLEVEKMYNSLPDFKKNRVDYTKFEIFNWKKQFFIAVCLNLGNLMVGYIVCWSDPTIQKLKNHNQTTLNDVISDVEGAWIASIYPLSNILGSQLSGYSSNVIGRKFTLVIAGVLIFIAHGIIVLFRTLNMIYLGRTIAGIGGGAISVGNLVYIGEIASPHIRGIMLSSTGVLHTCGGLLVYSIGPFLSFSFINYVLMLIALFHVVGMCYVPETPVFHVIKGQCEAARKTLIDLGRSKDIDKELRVMVENVKHRSVQYSLLHKTEGKLNWDWLDIFRRRRNRRALFITATLVCIQLASGVMCITFYATSILKNASSSIKAELATIMLGVTQVIGTLMAPFFIERCGRKKLLLGSTFACSVVMALLATHFYLELINHPLLASIRWLPLCLLVSFLFFYNVGLGIIPNTLIGEMFSPNVRSPGSSIAMSIGWISCFTSGLTFGYLVTTFGNHVTFGVFSLINALGFIFTLLFVPETKGKTLTEIEDSLAK